MLPMESIVWIALSTSCSEFDENEAFLVCSSEWQTNAFVIGIFLTYCQRENFLSDSLHHSKVFCISPESASPRDNLFP